MWYNSKTMKELSIQNGRALVFVDDEDYDSISRYVWRVRKDKKARIGYAVAYIEGKTVQMARFIMEARPGQIIDHKNGNGLDNRKENLRFCTQRQNLQNKRPQGKCKYKGVCRRKGERKWTAAICVEGFQYDLGKFVTPEEAAKEYDEAAIEHFGEFAWLNKNHFELFKVA